MIDLETIIAIAPMTYIIDSHAYELYLEDEKYFNNLTDKC